MNVETYSSGVVKDLVLVGGGHSHVQVIKAFAARPIRGLRITLVSREVHTPYSGMLPGFVAGQFEWDDIHIDLAPLCASAGARLFADTVSRLDLNEKLIFCKDQRPPVRFDWLSINCGSAPSVRDIAGAERSGVPVKPISRFLPQWEALLARLRERQSGQQVEPFRLAVVGGGAGGVELALSMQHRLERVEGIQNVALFIVTADREILFTHNASVRNYLGGELEARDIAVHRGARVESVEAGGLRTDTGELLAADEILWVTQAAPQAWVADAGLAADGDGFVRVNQHLQSISHRDVFAAGDIAVMEGESRPKSGVFAVRQGPVLSRNLRRTMLGKPLATFRPQHQFLSLISTGERRAVASRGQLSARGAWAWYWKRWIDRRFMARFRVDAGWNKVHRQGSADRIPMGANTPATSDNDGRRDRFVEVFERLKLKMPAEAVTRIGEDAVVLLPVVNSLQVQTMNGVPALFDDPHLLGRIAAEHSLNAVYAMGGVPRTATGWFVIPQSGSVIVDDDLLQLVAGAVGAFDADGVALVGGNSTLGVEMSVGFAVTGTVDERDIWRRHRISVGDWLVLTKPIGSGALLSAHRDARCQARWLFAALDLMQRSNRPAVPILREAGVKACNGVGVSGLLGVVRDMALAAKLAVDIWPAAVPRMDGALDALQSKTPDTGKFVDQAALDGIDSAEFSAADVAIRLLFDPQYSGGLLAAIRPEAAEQCLQDLRAAGLSAAAVIGRVSEGRDDGCWASLLKYD